jgi:hypothetical protein
MIESEVKYNNMIFIEKAKISSLKNLYFVNHHNHIKLYDKLLGLLGNFEVWHDCSCDNMEYITLNSEKLYIEHLEQK